MKIERLYCIHSLQTLNHTITVNVKNHTIEDKPELHGYLIDNVTVVPYGAVKEVFYSVDEPIKKKVK